MKKIVLLIAAVSFLGIHSFAQNESKFKTAKENIDKSNITIENPKKNTNPATWMDRGKLFTDAYNINVGFLRLGMLSNEASLFFKEPKQKLQTEEKGVKKETYEYSQINLNFADGKLISWEETKKVVNDPLGEAVKAYQKASSLDQKGKNAKKIEDAYKTISRDLETKFFNEYTIGKYKDAYQTAQLRMEVSNLLGITDTLVYFHAGYVAYAQSVIDSSMWQKAIDHFEKALSLGYKEYGEGAGQIYDLLYNSYIAIDKPDQALKYAQTGFEKYPNYEALMYDLINYYMKRGENAKTLEYLEQAVARDPKNSILLFAQGKVLDELGEREKSIAAYDAAIAINPEYFEPIYNKAVVYYNYAVVLYDKANEAKTNAEFDRIKNLADDEFAKAIPLLERALELRPNETATMDILKSLYYRLRSKYPDFEAKYNDMTKRLENKQK